MTFALLGAVEYSAGHQTLCIRLILSKWSLFLITIGFIVLSASGYNNVRCVYVVCWRLVMDEETHTEEAATHSPISNVNVVFEVTR